jgi:hypothetical protein
MMAWLGTLRLQHWHGWMHYDCGNGLAGYHKYDQVGITIFLCAAGLTRGANRRPKGGGSEPSNEE